MASASLKAIFCYFHVGGQYVKNAEGKMSYEGGRSNGRVIKEGMTHTELIGIITSCMQYESNGAEMKYTIKFDSSTFLDLEDDEGVAQLIQFNDNCAHVYIVEKGNQLRETPIKSSRGLELSPRNACASSPSSHELEVIPCRIQSSSPSSHEVEAVLKAIPCKIQSSFPPVQRKSSRLLERSSRNACTTSPSSHESEAEPEAIIQSSPSNSEPEAKPCTILSASAPIRRKSSRLLQLSSTNTCASLTSIPEPEPEAIPCLIQSASAPVLGLNTEKWKDLFVGAGQVFDNAVAFRQALYKYSIAHKFSYIFVKNSSKKMVVKCKIDGCKWKITANAMSTTSPMMSVQSFHEEHTHSAQDNLIVSPMARSKLTSSIIVNEIKSSAEKAPNEIRRDFYTEYGVSLTYRQAVRGKKRALEEMYGPSKHSFSLVPWMCERLMENDPNTVAKWSASTDNTFERLFIAYGCCINGFLLGSRPILYLDGYHLRGPYKVTLLAASAYDANNELFPVAYAIVCGVTFDEWSWFLHNVKEIIGSVQVTIVSYRHSAIIDAVKAIFGDERHAYCYRHLKENFSSLVTNFNKELGRNCGIGMEDALRLLDAIAYARLECDFDKSMGNLRSLSPDMAQWLETKGDIDQWALSRFPFRRWDNIATNLDETFSVWLVKEINHNVCVLIHGHQEKLAKMWCARKEATAEWKNGVGPNIEAKLKENALMAESMEVEDDEPDKMLVRAKLTNFIVNLASRDCTCKAWQMSGIPCPHACAAIKKGQGDVYANVEECYLLSSQQKIYSNIMIPVEINDMPRLAVALNDHTSQTFLKPPQNTRPPGRPGRPQSTRRESQVQHKKVYHCSICQELGHTRRTCKKSISCLEYIQNPLEDPQ
ncbi:hypothetical protein QN277_000981 [Acacia crassicarpa]|uniref:SWIM-type domain-containing protein n=1 Tax=Acacia crassicarpa TaxID=499986 RepID=A0AAE1N659_9FABA|nr:hypothetical protein QN277_000981 [Acacia crassicarpa]